MGRPQRRTGVLVRGPHGPNPQPLGGTADGCGGTRRQGDPARRPGPLLLPRHRRHRRGRRSPVRRRSGPVEDGAGHPVRGHRERCDLSGRQRRRLRHQVLPAVPGLPGPDLRDTGQPRLVRGPRRVHARLLRRRPAPPARARTASAQPGLAAVAAVAPPSQGRRPTAGRTREVEVGCHPAGRPAGALLGDRRRAGANRRHRHRAARDPGRRAGRLAARGVPGSPPEDPHHWLTPVRGRRTPPLCDRGRRDRRRDRP